MNWRTNTLSRVWPGRLPSRTHPTPTMLRPEPSANRTVPLLCTLPLTDPSAPPWKASSRTAPMLSASSAAPAVPLTGEGAPASTLLSPLHPALRRRRRGPRSCSLETPLVSPAKERQKSRCRCHRPSYPARLAANPNQVLRTEGVPHGRSHLREPLSQRHGTLSSGAPVPSTAGLCQPPWQALD